MLWDLIKSTSKEAHVFNSFLTQTNTSLTLSLLSLIRHHTVQNYLNLRTAIEPTALACYALYSPDENKFIKRHDTYNNVILDRPEVKKKAYDWLDANYPTHSGKLKSVKSDVINKAFTHSNLWSASSNTDYHSDPNLAYSNFFDQKDLFTTKFELMALANCALTQIDLIGSVIRNFPSMRYLILILRRENPIYSKKNWLCYQQIKEDPLYTQMNIEITE